MQEVLIDRKCAAPRFVIKPQSTFALEGHSARFTCRIISLTACTVTWYHNNVELKQSVKFMKKYIGDDYTFIINRAKVPDRGEFIIRAENHYGVSEEPVFLNVQAAPTDIKPYQPDPLPVRKREPKNSEITTKKGMRHLSLLSTLDLESFRRVRLANF